MQSAGFLSFSLLINNFNIMVLTIFQPTFITLMLTLPRFIRSGCYGAEADSRAAARIYFFINIDFHNTILQKNKSRSQLNLLDFYNTVLIRRLSSATSTADGHPNTSYLPGSKLYSSTISRYPLLPYCQVISWRVSRVSSPTTAIFIA